MKIVFADTTMDGPLIGGAHTFLVKLMGGLTNRAHEVHFVSKGIPQARTSAKIDESDAIIHTDIWNGSKLVDEATPTIAKWINGLRPDVFIVSVSPDIGWTVLPHLDANIATLTIGHNDQETFYAPARYYRDYLTRAIGVSEEICKRYVRDCGLESERVEWIPYGVGTCEDEPEANAGPIRLVYVGRFDEGQKRISDVVKVIRQLSGSGIDYAFELVGDGDEMPMVRRELANQIERGLVKLHGWVDGGGVLEIMRRSDVFVLASAFEGFCISLTEAMANGCCPVVTDIRSGNKQLVKNDVNGFVVPVGDIDAFVDRIELLASDRERLLEMRRLAWETGKQYGIERMVDNYIACFEKAVEDTRVNQRKPDPSFPLMPSCRSKYPLWLRRIKARLQKPAR